MKPIIDKTLIFAHRGASAYAPDNTLEAFELAHKMGADGIELDVRFTADGHIVVAHDEKIERMSNGRGSVTDYTLAELKQMDFGYIFYNGQRKGNRIATLDEVYDLVNPYDMIVNVEIKSSEPEMIMACNKIAEQYGMRDKIIYSSFNHYQIQKMKAMVPDAFIAPLHTFNLVNVGKYCIELGAQAAHPFVDVLKISKDYVKDCHEKGVRVHAWTANTIEDIQFLLDQGVDAIITNYPDIAIQLIDKK